MFFITDKETLGLEARKYRLLLAALYSDNPTKEQVRIQDCQEACDVDAMLEAMATRVTKYKPREGLSVGRV